MPASTIQVVARPKRRGIDLSPYPVEISEEMLISNFHLRVPEAAEKFGIGCTAFKRVCRRFGLMQWPYRKIKMEKIWKERLSKELSKELSKVTEKACEEWADSCVIQNETPNETPNEAPNETPNEAPPAPPDHTNHTQIDFASAEGSWGEHLKDYNNIPDANLQPLSDPFHDDWFMNKKVIFYPKFAIFNKIITNEKQTCSA